MIDEYGEFDGIKIIGETEVLEESLSPCHFLHQEYHMICFGIEHGSKQLKPATNRLNYHAVVTFFFEG
jgi:hypothetical protein